MNSISYESESHSNDNYKDLEHSLEFIDYQKDKDSDFNSSFKGNRLLLIKSNFFCWKNLFEGTCFSLNEKKIHNDSINFDTYFGIIICRRVTDLPIRYSNIPGSVVSKICSNSLCYTPQRYPCTPLNANFEKMNGEEILIDTNSRHIERSDVEKALLNIENKFDDFKEIEILNKRKRKREIRSNVDFLKQNLSIFPGNVGREYVVFQKYDEGIVLDKNAIMDATPELLAQHIARRLRGCTILDACSGVGGNTIAFSQHCKYVVSVEISCLRAMINRHNSQVYKLYGFVSDFKGINNNNIDNIDYIKENGSPVLPHNTKHVISEKDNLNMYFDPKSNIVFVNGDILKFCDWYTNKRNKNLKTFLDNDSLAMKVFRGFDIFEWAFASPPWGGYSYNSCKKFNLDFNSSIKYKDLFIKLSLVADNIALFLPRNTGITEFVGFLYKLGFYAIEIEAIRDTRYNYIVGLVFYCVRTRRKFAIEYLFGQTLNNIEDQITYNLINFIIDKKIKLKLNECSYEKNITENKFVNSLKQNIVKIGKKIGLKLRKEGLQTLSIFSYLLNYISYMDNKNIKSVNDNLDIYIPIDKRIKKIILKYKKSMIRYSKYIKLAIDEIESTN